MEDKPDLYSALEVARQDLKNAQARVAELEAKLLENQLDFPIFRNGSNYQQLFDNLLEGCQIIGFDWRCLYVNDTAAHFGRQQKSDLLGHTFMERYPGIEVTQMFAALQRCMTERTVENAEFEFVYADGSRAWFEFRIKPVPEGIFILTLDITPRKQVEDSLCVREQQLRIFVEHAPAAIAMLDRDMKYLLVSQRWLTDYHLTDQSIIGRSHYDVFPDVPERWRAIHKRCLLGAVERSDSDPFPRNDGSIDWVRWEIQPWQDTNGEIGGILLFSEVITESKQAELALRDSEARYRLLAENAADVIWILDVRSMRFIYVSPSVEYLRGYTPDEVRSQAIDEVVTPSSLALINRELPSRLQAFLAGDASAETRVDEIEQTRKDGSTVWTEVVTRLIKDGAGEVQIVGISREISARKQAEEQLRKLNRTLAVLSDVNQAIVRLRTIPSLFEAACQIAVNKGGFKMAWVGVRDDEVQRVNLVAHCGAGDDYLSKLDVVAGELAVRDGPTAIAVNLGERVVINDIERDPRMKASREETLQLGFRAMAVFPLTAFGHVDAALSLYTDVPDFFDDEELKLLDEMARDISFAIEFAEQEFRRQQAEALLRASEEKFRSLIESSEAVIAVFDADGLVRYGNPIAARALQLTPETIIGKHMVDLFPSAVAQYQLTSIRKVIETGEGTVAEAMSSVSGEDRWYRTSVQPLRDSAGKVTTALISAVEITRTKQAEGALRKANETLEQKVEERTAELQAAKTQVEGILENSIDGILLVSADYSIVRTNHAFVSLLACETDGCENDSLFDLIYLEDRGRGQLAIQKIITEQVGNQIEVRVSRKDGSIFDAEIGIGRLRNDEFVCTVRDISERKEQERQLRYYASLQEGVIDAVIVTDMEFRIQSWNKAAERIYGWRAEEVAGKAAPDLLQIRFPPTQDRESGLKQFNERGFLQQETVQRRKDGTDICILGSATRLEDEKGVPIGVISVNHDISERKALERQLRYHASLQEDISDAVIVTDTEFRIQSWNKAAERVYGWRADEVVGKASAEILGTEYSSPFDLERNVQELREQGWWQDEVIQHHKDGSIRHILGSVTLVKDESGLPVGIVSVNHDITERKHSEEMLRQSEERFALVFRLSPVAISLTTTAEGRYLDVNESLLKLLGYSREEMIGRTAGELNVWDTPAQRVEAVRTIRENGSVRGLEVGFRKKTGEVCTTLTSIVPVVLNGQPCLLSIVYDITERKRAEDALQEKLKEEREFQGYLMALHEITIDLTQVDDLDTFYRRAVEHGLQHLGLERLSLFLYDPETNNAVGTYGTDTNGKPVDERRLRFVPAPDGIMGRAFLHSERFYLDENVRLSGSRQETVGTGWNAASVLWNGTQSLGWLVADNLLSHKPATKPLLAVLSLYALTIGTLLARKQTNVALRESEARLRELQQMLHTVLDTIPVRVFWKDKNSIYLGCNRLVAQDAGANAPEELVGKRDDELAWREQAASYVADDRAVIESGIPRLQIEEEITRIDGSTRWLQTNKIPLRDAEDEIIGVLGAHIDITERKQAEEELGLALEQQKELVNLKARFISMASHDFRTPMSVILSSLSLLEMQISREFGTERLEPLQKRFKRIDDAVRQMTTLLDDVLAVSRADAGKVEIHPEPLDVEIVCKEIVQEIELTASPQHHLILSVTGETTRLVSDKQLLRQILVNLLANAVKYSPQGGEVLLDVHCEPETAEFRVQDHGIGIPEQDQEHLFETFHRARNVGDIPGTGLGMAITQRAVDSLGGMIGFESQVGVGTTFLVRLPSIFTMR